MIGFSLTRVCRSFWILARVSPGILIIAGLLAIIIVPVSGAMAILSVQPSSATTNGGTEVTITAAQDTHFIGASSVKIAGFAATIFNVTSDTTITVVTPAGDTGAADIVISTPHGEVIATGVFSYSTEDQSLPPYPPPAPVFTGLTPVTGPEAGGTSVTITGSGFTGATQVTISGARSNGFSVIRDTEIVAVTPAGTAGSVDIIISTPQGDATGTGVFTYQSTNTVAGSKYSLSGFSGIAPAYGSTTGGEAVTITGSQFTGASSVTIGGSSATSVVVISDNQITAITPAGSLGSADVVVSSPGGTSTGAGAFTYKTCILIVTGPDVLQRAAASRLSADLSGSTKLVTTVEPGVPGSLSGYSQIFDTRYNNNPPFTDPEMNQYLAFLNAAPNNTLVLIGENTGFAPENQAISRFIMLAGGGNIPIPGFTSMNSERVNPPFTGPNNITNVTFASSGLVTDPGTGAFASSETGGGSSLFFTRNRLYNAPQGALVVVYDVNFITSPALGVNATPFRQNMEHFAASPPQGQPIPVPVVSGLSPTSGPASGTTRVIITGTGFSGAGSVLFGSTPASMYAINNDSSIAAIAPSGAGTVDITVTTPGGTSVMVAADQFTYLSPLSSMIPEIGRGDNSNNGPESVDVYAIVTPVHEASSNVSVNVGGTSPVFRVVVIGTGVTDLIVTATKASGPGSGIHVPPGTVFGYVEITPARFTTITGGQISFKLPQSWMDTNNFIPTDIILYRNVGNSWHALPTTFEKMKDGMAYFTASSPGFSQFAISGIHGLSTVLPDTTDLPVVQVTSEMEKTSGTTSLAAARKPVTTQTPVALPVSPPSPGFPFATIALVGVVVVILTGSGFMVRRWLIRRQNPALFRDLE